MNQRRISELLRMRADLAAKMAEVDGELAAAFGDEAPEPANDTTKARPKKQRRPTIVRVPTLTREPTELERRQADAALRELGYR